MKILDRHNRRWLAILALILISLFALLPNTVKARPQQAITLLYFQGTGQNNAILLEWATATEFETAGFELQRADSQSGPYEDLDEIGFIPGEGDGVIGAEYEVTDSMNVVNGQTYWYILVELETGGNENPTDPISVTGGVATATPTNTPTTPANNQSTPTPTQTRTPTPTNTAQATSQNSATAVPTNTQAPNQPTSQSNPTTQPTATTQTSNATSSTGTTNSTGSGGNVAEASSPTDPYPAQGSPSPTFVPDPNFPNPTDPAAAAYPAGGEETNGAAYPAGAEPTAEGAAVETPAIQPQGDDVRELSTQPPLNPPTTEAETAQSEGSNTLFLWVGFTAALLIFAGGIIGSIILFTRRSNQK